MTRRVNSARVDARVEDDRPWATTGPVATLEGVADAPNFPPGPRGPEDDVPGALVRLSAEQATYFGEYVATVEEASSVEIEERGAAYLDVRVFDFNNDEIDHRRIFPLGNRHR